VLGALAAALAAGVGLPGAAQSALAWGARCVGGLGPSALGLAPEFEETT
jgi:hypothetical protein